MVRIVWDSGWQGKLDKTFVISETRRRTIKTMSLLVPLAEGNFFLISL